MSSQPTFDDDLASIERILACVDEDLRFTVFRCLGRKGKLITDNFFRSIMSVDEAAGIINQDIISDKLGWIVRLWLTELFFFPRDGSFMTLIKHQEEVGRRHASVKVPPSAMNKAVTILKREMFQAIIDWDVERTRLHEVIIYVNEMIDWAVGIINRTSIKDMLTDERDEQSLRYHVFSVDMALQVEILRASLFDWHRQVLMMLQEDFVSAASLPAMRRTNLGLWVIHKGDLLLPETEEIAQIKFIIGEIDKVILKVGDGRLEIPTHELRCVQPVIGQYVSTAASILGNVSDRILTMDGGRDPLTRLFNRRFLRAIMQREIKLSLSSGDRFAVIMADIDCFKTLNDTHGHICGDAIIQNFAEVLESSTRAGDFIFRYGGEEFLILIPGVNPETALAVAEKLRSAVEHGNFRAVNGISVSVTASFGVAVHDGFPDYNRVLEQSDAALYAAKRGGRNRCILFQEAKELTR